VTILSFPCVSLRSTPPFASLTPRLRLGVARFLATRLGVPPRKTSIRKNIHQIFPDGDFPPTPSPNFWKPRLHYQGIGISLSRYRYTNPKKQENDMPRSQLQNKTRVNVLLEKDEYEAYKADSYDLGIPFNAWVRMSLRQATGWHPPPRDIPRNAVTSA